MINKIIIQNLYQQVLKEEVTKDSFLYQVRRDERFSSFITNVVNYEHAIQQLKRKGYIYDLQEAEKDVLATNLQLFTEATKKPKLTRDTVNDIEFQMGWREEYYAMKPDKRDQDKAAELALKNINKDPIYYTRLKAGEKLEKKDPTDPVEVGKNKAKLIDKDNATKPLKGSEKAKADPKGPSEKAKGKPTGVKQMKDSAPMKSLKEELGLDEGSQKINKKYTHFFLLKSTNKIINGFEYAKDMDKESIAYYAKYDLADMDLKPKDVSVLTVRGCKQKGIDPFDPNNWGNPWGNNVDESKKKILEGDLDHRSFQYYIVSGNKIIVGFKDRNGTGDFIHSHPGMGLTIKSRGELLQKDIDPQIDSNWKLLRGVNDYEFKYKNMREGITSTSDDKPVKGKEVSFTIQDKNNPDKRIQVKKTVQSGKKTKNDEFQFTLSGGLKLVISKSNRGISSVYFDSEGSNKVVDIDKNLSLIVDKIFPKDGEKINEYADDDDKDRYNEIEEEYGTPEIKKILDKVDNLGFNLPGEAMNEILIDRDFLKNWDLKGSLEHGEITEEEIQKLVDWRNKYVKKKTINNLRESIKSIIRKKLNETPGMDDGPNVKKKKLNDLMTRYDWYFEDNDDKFVKEKGQLTHDKVIKLVQDLGREGIDIFNSYAPDDKQMGNISESMTVGKDGKLSNNLTHSDGWHLISAIYKSGDTDLYDKVNNIQIKSKEENNDDKLSSDAYLEIEKVLKQKGVYDKYKQYLDTSVNENNHLDYIKQMDSMEPDEIADIVLANGFHKDSQKNKVALQILAKDIKGGKASPKSKKAFQQLANTLKETK